MSLLYRALSGGLGEGRRGMTYWYDYLDWLGGLPFEVASVKDITSFFEARGLALEHQKITTRMGCNEFVFRRI